MTDAESLKPSDTDEVVLEAWSQGFMVGALVIMCGITLANMRKGVLLHKLILVEPKLTLAIPNGFFMFFDPPAWGWFLSSTVVLLITSWTLHNVIAWMKNKPFLTRRGSFIYISSVLLVQPYWVLEIYTNFAYFNGINSQLFISTRPYEAVFRQLNPLHQCQCVYLLTFSVSSDPWWIFTIGNLFWNIKYQYQLSVTEMVRVCPRFGILLGCMCLSVVCIIVDILSVTPVIPIGVMTPFWKFAFVFKCFTDSIILDDFKTALDKLSRHNRNRILPLDAIGDATSMQSVCMTQRPRKWPNKFEQNSVGGPMEIEEVATHSHVELSDVDGLCPPSQVFVNRVEGGRR